MKKYFHFICAAAIAQMPVQAIAKNAAIYNTKGEYYFAHHGYDKALGFYNDLLENGGKKRNAAIEARIADCYRLTDRPQMAIIYYSKAFNDVKPVIKRTGKSAKTVKPELEPEVSLHYGEALMTIQCYEDAAMRLRDYQAAVPGDRRVANLIQGCQNALAAHNTTPEGVETFLPINTDLTDYGPVINNQYLVFTSDTSQSWFAKKDKFTNEHFYKLYRVTTTKEGVTSNDFDKVDAKGIGKFHDANASFTKDGQTMYFTRTFVESDFLGQNTAADDKNVVHLQIMMAEDYDQAGKRYNKVIPFPYNNKEYSTKHPAISPDGTMLIFASDKPGGSGSDDLYVSKKGTDGTWSEPANLGTNINTEGDEVLPVFLDNNTITFASNGQPGYGGLDVYYTTWDNATHTWSTPVNAGTPVNSSFDDMSLTMYDDQQNGYFASNRPAERASDNIYHYYRQKLVLKLNIADANTGNGVSGATITMAGTKDQYGLQADARGNAITPVTPLQNYKVVVTKPGYHELRTTLSSSDVKRMHDVDTFSRTLKLDPEQQITFTAKILDEETRKPIEDPLIVITKEGSNRIDTLNMATGALLNYTLEPNNVYHINSIKDKYYSDEKVVSTQGLTGIIKLTDTLMMCKLGVGAICQIENIYYDFNKANIRADAKPSMDKLLKFLKFFPHMTIQLNSHTDCRGSDAYNMRLSSARAQAVVQYLISKGISPSRLKGKGYGESKPIYKCEDCETCDDQFRQKNRRTEFEVLTM